MIQLPEQTSRLVKDELELARLELKESAKHAGIGAGLFSAAGLLGFFGVATLIAAAVIALDLALPLWASALIMAALILLAAAVAADVKDAATDDHGKPKPAVVLVWLWRRR